jgi:3-oxoacyl-[acyl-carrier protein] reductase
MFSLKEKVALVTGASQGIGRATALALAEAGARVGVAARSADKLASLVSEVEGAGGAALAVPMDVADAAQVKAGFQQVLAKFGRLDILVNNAGVYEFAPLEAITEAHVRKLFDVNVLGVLFASQAAARYFDAAGGSIINISSAATSQTLPSTVVYTASKAAVEAITQTLAKELGPRNIRVNAINPGGVETEGVHAAGLLDNDFAKQLQAQTPLGGRIGQPQDIAPVAVFLASADAAWITGEILRVAGGLR